MALLVALTLLVVVASVAVTARMPSRAEAVVAASLVCNAIIVAPIYALGLAGHLDRISLGVSVLLECAALLAVFAHREGARALLRLPARALELLLLPAVAIREGWRQRSLTTVGAIVATAALPYMALVSYLAPSWRDWDGLWYHEPLIALTIQNHGFAPEPLPGALQVINGVHRLGEMTQLWFGIYGGRPVIEMANVATMPLHAACVFLLVRRYAKDTLSGVAWASAFVLFPGYLRLVQTTLVDPQACALLMAAAYYVTHPELDRKNAVLAILATTLAAGAKIWSVVPVGILSVFLLVRLVRRRADNGGLATAGLIGGGAVFVLGVQAITYVRNLILFKNPVWPMISYDNPRLGIHWAGGLPVDFDKTRGGIDFNLPFLDFCQKMLAPPYSVTGPGHIWQVNDYGFAWAWLVLPLFTLAVGVIAVRWLVTFVAVRLGRPAGPDHDSLSSAMMLAIVASVSLSLSPAIYIARYHVASLGMLAGALAFATSRWRGKRLLEDAGLFAQLGSVLLMAWVPLGIHSYVYLYRPQQIVKWLATPLPKRELEDITVPGISKPLQVAPGNYATTMARERELAKGDVIGFDYIDYYALLWNNAYSNKVVWLGSSDPLAEAERAGAKWLYTRGGTLLYTRIAGNPSWELVGPLEGEAMGSVWRKRR